MRSHKDEVITFKAEASLAEAIRNLPNRSAFIRAAILSALDHACPLCQGTGIMSPEQKRHWETFSQNHQIDHCRECDAVHLVCSSAGSG